MKMNKGKGFTLVELLAVIVVLAIVLIVAVPGVLSVINQSKQKSYDMQLEMIKEAGRLYVTERGKSITWKNDGTNKVSAISLKQLQEKGYLEKKVIDPRNKKEIKNVAVLVTKTTSSRVTYQIVYLDDSGASYPSYSAGMIPVVYKDNKWVKADPSNENQSWFDYSKQQWANIATVTEDVRQTLVDAAVGTEVPMDKINTMFVWIPRYRYKLWNIDGTELPTGNPNMAGDYMIDVRFESVNEDKSTGTQNGQWLTHPAFTFGGQDLDGFWVAKFETGYKDATNMNEGLQDTIQPDKIIVKPNCYAWRQIKGVRMFDNALQVTDEGNVFGFNETSDSHLMKNMEWGAMAYLTYSPYGKAGNSSYSGEEKQVRRNANNTAVTGCGASQQDALATDTCESYETPNGQAASTTGNISGIYDVSGRWNVLAGVMKDLNGNLIIGDSDFSQERLNELGVQGKYFDVYEYGTVSYTINRGHLGDATIEVGPIIQYNRSAWYEDYAAFVFQNNSYNIPWFARGGGRDDFEISGIMEFGYTSGLPAGAGHYLMGWRLTLL